MTATQASSQAAQPATTFESRNPATDEVIATFPVHAESDVSKAVERARGAAAWWRDLGHDGRKRRMRAWRTLLVRRSAEFAELVHLENGKPVDDALGEIILAIEHVSWAASNAEKVLGRRRVAPGMLAMNHTASAEYVPFGVVGVIGPWNYPVHTPMGSITYALAAGNAVVFKPSEYTPAIGKWLVDAFAEVVPEQPVFGLVTGFGATGAALCRAGVDKLAFTGSTATGKKVMAACAETLTPILIECGGKDALIVADDADLDAADAAADYGPMTMPAQIDVIRRHIDDALARGGRAVVGGPESVQPPYVQPVVLVDVPEDSAAVQEETFGPTVTITRVRDVDEAVRLANANPFGLGGAVFSAKHGEQIAARLSCGMVSINSAITFATVPGLPFGGVRNSGFGRIHGPDGLREFAWPRAVTHLRYPSPIKVLTFRRTPRDVAWLVRMVKARWGR